jgi:hypothetical protein
MIKKKAKREGEKRENRGKGNIDGRQSLWGWGKQVPRGKGCFIKRNSCYRMKSQRNEK